MSTKTKWLIGLVFLVITLSFPVSAQSEASIRLNNLNLSAFPSISAYMDVRGQNGYFVSGLPDNAATVFEDEQPITAAITEARPGAQIVVAYTGGDAFGVINLNLQTRFDALKSWLLSWSGDQLESGLDDLSLLVPEGVVVSHASDPQVFIEGLQNYTPDFGTAVNPVEMLSAAIDLALDPAPKDGMGRVVIFLTAGLTEDQQTALLSQVDRAAQGGVRLQIGLINSSSAFSSNQAIQLQSAAQQTDGQYFAYSSEETFPDLNLLVESSRRMYLMEYRSRLTTSGTHTIQMMINADIGEILGDPQTFETNILAPTPVFVSPPAAITRLIPDGMRDEPENLVPTFLTQEVLIEFPDGYPREITHLALYVNNTLAAETSEAPFTQITYDLTPYQIDETLNMRLEVTDELGLTATSIEIPIDVTIQGAQSGLIPGLSPNAPFIIIGVIALSGSILFLVLVIAGRIQPRKLGERRQKRQANEDPLTQPVDSDSKAKPKAQKEEKTAPQTNVMERISQHIPTPRLQWPSRTPAPETESFGYLVQVTEDGETLKNSTFQITVNELTFGTDPRRATLALDNPSIEPLHARMWRNDDGQFHLEDSGSVAGTWVNYAPVSANGTLLHHGDLIHIGKKAFRFTLNHPPKVRKPVVTALAKPPAEDEV